MLYIEWTHGGWPGGHLETATMDATERDLRARVGSPVKPDHRPPILVWAQALADRIGREQPTEHVAIFVPEDDPERDGLRLVAQIWGPAENTGEVVVGAWTIPLHGSVCGRVYRTGLAALSADVTMDPDYLSFPGSRTRSALTVPVGPPGGVVAVINVEAPFVAAFSIRDYERLTARAAEALATYPGRDGR